MTSQYPAPTDIPISYHAADNTPVQPPAPFHWRTFKLPASDPDAGTAIGWELKLDDVRGGYLQSGDFARGSNLFDGDYRMTASSTLDGRWRRHLLLPFDAIQQTNLVGSATLQSGLFWTYCNGYLYMGTGKVAGHCLFVELISVGALVEQSGYDPGGVNITCLGAIKLPFTGSLEQLFVGRLGQPPQITNSAGGSGAVMATMHANLSSAWGIISSPVNAQDPQTGVYLILANTGIYSLPKTAGATDQPTQVQASIPPGGCAVGAIQFAKGPYGLLAVWAWPVLGMADSFYSTFPSNFMPWHIVHTNMEGSDPVELEFGMPFPRHFCIWQNKVVVSNGSRIVAFDGEALQDLGFMENRRADSDMSRRITGVGVNGRDLVAIATSADLTTLPTTVGKTTMRVEEYVPEYDAWLNSSPVLPLRPLANTQDVNYSVFPASVVFSAPPHWPPAHLHVLSTAITLHGAQRRLGLPVPRALSY